MPFVTAHSCHGDAARDKCHLKVNGLELQWQFKANFRQWSL